MSGDEPKTKKPSPGRYSLSTESSSEAAAVRIDSTRSMPAVTPPAADKPPERSSQSALKSLSSLAFGGAAKPPPLPAKPPPPPPPPPPPRRSTRPPPSSGGGVFDEGSILHAFDALMAEDDRPSQPGTHEADLTPVRELFAELAAGHMRHVRDFMIDLKWGETTRDWIEICLPAVTSLRRAAERLDLGELAHGLDRLAGELNAATTSGGRTIEGEAKQRLLDAYGQLVALLPQAFALERDRTQREAVIVQTLLLQIPDVRKVTIDKLHAAGLTSLEVLFAANAPDIAAVAGIPDALAARIVARVAGYRRELEEASPRDARAAEREKLATLTATLKVHHQAFEKAKDGWSPEDKAEKRARMIAREEAWLAITLLLARFGEVDTLKGIEKVPFAQRITQIEAWLEDAADRYRSAPEA